MVRPAVRSPFRTAQCWGDRPWRSHDDDPEVAECGGTGAKREHRLSDPETSDFLPNEAEFGPPIVCVRARQSDSPNDGRGNNTVDEPRRPPSRDSERADLQVR